MLGKTDYFGQEVNVGDVVGFIDNHYKYTLITGVIVKISDKKVTIETHKKQKHLKFFSQIVKAPK